MPLDIRSHLRNDNYDASTMRRRLVWGLAEPLFRFSPRALYGWRNRLLKLLGAKLGSGVRLYPSVQVAFPWNIELGDHVVVGRNAVLYSLGRIVIGSNVLISQGAHLCAGTHDYRQPNLPLLCPEIRIADNVWLAAECFVGPGVTVGDGSVVGARAVVIRDVPPRTVVAGNPARAIKSL